MPTTAAKDVIRAIYAAIAAGDMAAFVAALHPGFEAELPGYLPWGGTHRGREAFLAEVLPAMAGAVNVSSFALQAIYGEGDKVFATATARARASGEAFMIGEDRTVADGQARHLRLYYFDPTPVLGREALTPDRP